MHNVSAPPMLKHWRYTHTCTCIIIHHTHTHVIILTTQLGCIVLVWAQACKLMLFNQVVGKHAHKYPEVDLGALQWAW